MKSAYLSRPGVLLVVVAFTSAFLAGCGDDADEAHPAVDTDSTTTTTTSEPRRLEHGGEVELDVVYAYPMDLHCGLDQLGELNGTNWVLTEAPGGNPETGAGEAWPDHWPMTDEGVDGWVVLAGEDRIEYSLPDGELIAIYEPSPDPFVPCE